METIKKYWWLFLLVPIAGYIIWVYYRAKKEVNDSTARAREAKELKRLEAQEAKANEGTDTNN